MLGHLIITSLYWSRQSCADIPFDADWCKNLQETGQDVPEFLVEEAKVSGPYTAPSRRSAGGFGGRDFRKSFRPRTPGANSYTAPSFKNCGWPAAGLPVRACCSDVTSGPARSGAL